MEFINFQTGKVGKAVLYQDNTSENQLHKNGKTSSNKTKHMKIRYFWIKDKVALTHIYSQSQNKVRMRIFCISLLIMNRGLNYVQLHEKSELRC
jgi:hypothetical protein